MSGIADSVRARIAQKETFTLEEIVAFMNTDDLDLWSAVYEAVGGLQIVPEPGIEMSALFTLRYLLRCIRENLPSGHIHSGFEAAWELSGWLKHWCKSLAQMDSILRVAEAEIRREFLAVDEGLRNRLLCGTLEHALESSAVRPYFASWASNSNLQKTWQEAMDWASRHSGSSDWP